jgi:outer membrane receptor protein involved in Fe transport
MMTGTAVDIPFDLDGGYYWDLADLEKLPETPGVYGQKFSQEFSNVSGRLVAQYFFSDDINVYASYSTGYRAGGFNDGYFNSATGTPDDFSEEDMESWEVGIKSMLLDGRVRFNATYFSYEYTDMQVSTIDTTGGNLAQQTDNAADASRDGIEIDAAWAITPSLRLKATYAFIDGDFDKFPDFLGLNVRAQPGMLPESAATLVMDWDVLKAGNGTLNLQLVANYQDDAVSIATTQGAYASAAFPTPVPVAFDQTVNNSRTLVDARLSWLHEMDNGQALSVALWGRNITDEEYRTFNFNFGPDLGLSLGQWGAPATYGVDVRYQF